MISRKNVIPSGVTFFFVRPERCGVPARFEKAMSSANLEADKMSELRD
jgi:hypothetical protein